MDLKRLRLSDFAGFLGAGILLLSLWLPWFHTACDSVERRGEPIRIVGSPEGCNENSVLKGDRGDAEAYGSFSAWEIFNILDWLLVAACTAPFILAWIVIRGHELT